MTSTATETDRTSVSSTDDFHPQQNTKLDYTWGKSFKDWIRHATSSEFSNAKVEERLLSLLPFFPKSDGRREAKVIDTKLDDGNVIHEFYIENKQRSGDVKVKDVVLVHGYAASLGLFINNFDSLLSIPGIRVHAIDLLGFGFSSRPSYPKFKMDTREDIEKVEGWFIDSMEEWRQKRNISEFVLMGHSFGGYLSCAYAMKYNKKLVEASNRNMISKLVLISPVGVERSQYSYLKDVKASGVSEEVRQLENNKTPKVDVAQEFTANQHDITHGTFKASTNDDGPRFTSSKWLTYLWERHVSPFSIIRNVGFMRSRWISRWTGSRFAEFYNVDPEQFQKVHDYIYRVFNAPGSGEYAITRILAPGALARLPLVDRVPKYVASMDLPTLWIYGDRDWMNRDAGKEINHEINTLNRNLLTFATISNAGHHLYLDNPVEFASTVFKFLGVRK